MRIGGYNKLCNDSSDPLFQFCNCVRKIKRLLRQPTNKALMAGHKASLAAGRELGKYPSRDLLSSKSFNM